MKKITKEDVINIMYDCIDEINYLNESTIKKTPDTKLFGSRSELDSLGLVNLIVSAEEKISDVLKVTISLADEKAMSEKNSPFRTVDSLAEYILKLLNK